MSLMPFDQALAHLLTTSWEVKKRSWHTDLYSTTRLSADSLRGYPHIHIKYTRTKFQYIGITYGPDRDRANFDIVIDGAMVVGLASVRDELADVSSAEDKQIDALIHILNYTPVSTAPVNMSTSVGYWPTPGEAEADGRA